MLNSVKNDNVISDFNNTISLKDIKQKYGLETNNILEYETFYNFYTYDKHYIDRLYFNYIIMIGNYMKIHKFIIDYINNTSIYVFETFVNSPLYVPMSLKHNNMNHSDGVYHLYPVTTCMMWNNDPQLLRLLITFGAVVHEQDNFGYYPEEAIRHIYYFNPIPYLDCFEQHKDIEKYNKTHYRDIKEYTNIINEMRYISGEDICKDWFYPI